jgi:hypothetical protein
MPLEAVHKYRLQAGSIYSGHHALHSAEAEVVYPRVIRPWCRASRPSHGG